MHSSKDRSSSPSSRFLLTSYLFILFTIFAQAKAFSFTNKFKFTRPAAIATTATTAATTRPKTSKTTFLSQSSSSSSSMSSELKSTNANTAATTAVEEDESNNWRVFPLDYPDDNNPENTDIKIPSPFQHDKTSTTTWSEEQYQNSLAKYHEFTTSQDSYIAPLLNEAIQVLLHAYRLYGPQNVIGSFNGGKDAVVIMELMKAAHAKYYHDLIQSSNDAGDGNENGDGENRTMNIIRPRVIYFNHRLEFPQVYDFVRSTVHTYDLDMIAFEQHISFVQGLDILVQRNDNVPMSFVLGTRATDPNAGNQGSFAPSSSWMPPFMRVNPILDWTYGHTWHFLRLFKIPYCHLYDEGYTSLGHVEDTLPCPALMKVKVVGKDSDDYNESDNDSNSDSDSDDSCDYYPAYMLKDWDQERAGRMKKEKKKKEDSNSSNVVAATNDESGSTSTTPTSISDLKTAANATITTTTSTSTPASTPASTPTPTKPLTSIQVPNVNNEKTTSTPTDDDDDASTSTTTTSMSTQRSVGLLIIGDEILKGLTPDTNTHSAALALQANNVPLAKVSVVSDDLDEIVREIEYMSSLVDVIITSGGVGPTHDDVTIKSVGKALDSALSLNKNMADLLQRKMKKVDNDDDDDDDEKEEKGKEGVVLTEAQIKMATLPECSKLRYLSKNKDDWPVLQCQNIFILPGVPQFFEPKVALVASYLSTELVRSVAFKVVLSIDENSIVSILNNVVSNHPNVSFGSYPFVNHPEYKTVVTLEGRRVGGGSKRNSSRFLSIDIDDYDDVDMDVEQFEKEEIDLNVKVALADLVNGMPEGSVLRVDNNNDLTFV